MIRYLLQFSLIILVAVIIWFVGPMIAVSGKIWLASPTIRLALILDIFVCWSLYAFFLIIPNIKSKRAGTAQEAKPQESKNKTSFDEYTMVLNKHFMELCNTIKKRAKKKFWRRPSSTTPVHLLIGTKNSGKSSLLENSQMHLTSIPTPSKQLTSFTKQTHDNDSILEHDESHNVYANEAAELHQLTEICYWHLSKDQLFLDTPGGFATSEVDSQKLTPWLKVLNLLKLQKKQFPLSSMLVCINLQEIASGHPQQFMLNIHLLRQRILEIRKHFNKALPLYIIFTKCDLIHGFREFFDNLSQQERQEKLGILLSTQQQNLTENFKQEFDSLLQQLNDLVINRLHQEHNPDKREAIKDFPTQLEQLKERIIEIVFHLAEKTSYCDAAKPMGVYFSSSMQLGQPLDILQNLLKKKLRLSSQQLTSYQPMQSKPYFIAALFNKISQLHKPQSTAVTPYSNRTKQAILATATIIVLGCSITMGMLFKNDLLKLSKTQNSLYAYQMLENNAQNTLAQTNAKQLILTEYQHASRLWAFNLVPHWSQSKSSTIPSAIPNTIPSSIKSLTQQNSLMQNFIPQLVSLLKQQLQNPNTSSDVLYQDLKVYLMLAKPNYLQMDFLTHWLQKHSQFETSLGNINIKLQLTNALAGHMQLIKLDQPLVESTRHNLLSLPKQFLAYLILKNDLLPQQQAPLELTVAEQHISIPFLYTARGLQTLFLNGYQNAAKQAVLGNWVLGSVQASNSQALQKVQQQVEQGLIDLYTTDYANWWKNKYARLNLPRVDHIHQANALFNKLTSTEQGLTAFIQGIKNNTDANKILPPTVNNPIIAYMRKSLQQAFGQRFNQLKQINLIQLQNALLQINKFLNALVASGDVQTASFAIAKQQFLDPRQQNVLTGFANYTQKLPSPFNTWLSQLSTNLWQQIMANAKTYINVQWKNQVLPIYQKQLQNYYPLFNTAVTDSNLTAFTNFFNPHGTINNFFNDYLAAFINRQQSQWQWKVVNGSSLNFSKDILDTFVQARIITSMFFSEASDQINVHFSLQPIAMMPIVKNFNLTINGQSLHDHAGSKNISQFIWPGNSSHVVANIDITTVNGQHAKNSLQGQWAWFHLLEQAHIQESKDPRKFTLTFDVAGNAAKYQLTTANIINPFIPGIIDQFRAPANLG